MHTPNERSIAINIWWWRRDGPFSKEELDTWDKCPQRNHKVTVGNCKFGYEPPENHTTPFSLQRTTHCRGLEDLLPPTGDAVSNITSWLRFPRNYLASKLRKAGVKDIYNAPVDLQVKIQEQTQKRQWGQTTHVPRATDLDLRYHYDDL